MDLSSVSLSSQRLFLKSFASEDAFEAFEATTPTLTRFMGWEPAPSLEAFAPIWQSWFPMMCVGTDVHFVVRVKPTLEFLGMAGLHNTSAAEPETGIWIRESQHGYGYGREAIAAVISFAARELGKRASSLPRRRAERFEPAARREARRHHRRHSTLAKGWWRQASRSRLSNSSPHGGLRVSRLDAAQFLRAAQGQVQRD